MSARIKMNGADIRREIIQVSANDRKQLRNRDLDCAARGGTSPLPTAKPAAKGGRERAGLARRADECRAREALTGVQRPSTSPSASEGDSITAAAAPCPEA